MRLYIVLPFISAVTAASALKYGTGEDANGLSRHQTRSLYDGIPHVFTRSNDAAELYSRHFRRSMSTGSPRNLYPRGGCVGKMCSSGSKKNQKTAEMTQQSGPSGRQAASPQRHPSASNLSQHTAGSSSMGGKSSQAGPSRPPVKHARTGSGASSRPKNEFPELSGTEAWNRKYPEHKIPGYDFSAKAERSRAQQQ